MNANNNWRKRIKQIFVPPFEGSAAAWKEILPFFFLLTVVLVGMYILTLINSTLLENPIRLAVFSLLFLIHLLLYWMILKFSQDEKSIIQYILIQGILAFVLVLISANTNIVIALYSSLAGTTVGIAGRTRMTILGGVFYTLLGFLSIFLVSDLETLRQFSIFFLASVGFSSFFAYAFFRQIEAREESQRLLNELEEAHQQLSKYALEVENLSITNERQRMARQLHDTLAQGLAGLILQLEAADIHIEKKRIEKTQEILKQALSRARATLVDARRAIDDLRIEQSDPQKLAEGITREIERFNTATGIPCQLSLDLPEVLSEEISEHIFRTVTEGLGNIARHAQASRAVVEITLGKDHLDLRICDNGIGFNPEDEITKTGHYGLLGIRERARLAGGTLTIDSAPGEGTQIHLTLPTGESAHG